MEFKFVPQFTRPATWTTMAAVVLAIIGARATWRHLRQWHHRRRRAERLASLLRYANDIILVADGELRVVDANMRAMRAYGYDISELRRLTLRDLCARHCVPDLDEQVRRWESPAGASYETVHRRRDDTLFTAEVSVAVAPVGGERFYVSIIRDITQRKHDEVRLRVVNAAMMAAPNSIIITDPDFCVKWVNPAFLRETGYSFAEVLGKNIRALKSAGPEHTRESELKRELCAGRIWRGELINRRTDGSVYVEDATITPVMDENGALTHVVGINSDVTHRRYAELAARQAAERYRVLFEQNPHSMWMYDCDTLQILAVNDAAIRKYGYTREEFVRLTVDALQVDAVHRRTGDAAGDSAPCGLPPGRHRTKAGAVFFVETTFHSLDWMGRKACLVLVTDVTDRLKAEDALKESEARFSSAFVNAPIGMGLVALDGRWLLVNRALCDLLGYTSDQLRQLTIHDITHPDDRPATVAATRELRTGDAPASHTEERYRTRSGAVVTVRRSACLVRDAHGAPHHVIVQVLDITAAKRAEQQLREQADLLNKTSDAIFVTDLARRITFWNRAAERITGYVADETVLQPARCVFGPAIDALLESAAAAADAQDEFRAEWVICDRGDRKLALEARTTLIRDPHGAPTGHITIATDVTERKQLHEQVLHSQRLDSLGMLAAGIAHDLNNVLSPIVMAVPMLRLNAKDPTDLFLLDTLEKAGHRGTGLVRQILAFAHRPDSEVMQVAPKHFLHDVAQVVQQTFPKSIVLEQDIPGDLWQIMANPTHMHQVLLNLAVNARDAMPNGGTLGLRGENRAIEHVSAEMPGATRPGRWVVFTVSDTGTGIPSHVLAQMWEPFFTTKPRGQGTGLGLSTVRGIVEKHGGFITVATESGHGSTFEVHLPAIEAPDILPPTPATTTPLQGDALVLLAEDEEGIRSVAVHILQRHGYRVVTATNGNEAVALFRARADDIALVLTDVDMPEAGGFAVARAVHAENPDIPILGMSGFETPGAAPELAAAFALFMRKPFTPEILIEHVERALERSRGRNATGHPVGTAAASIDA